MENERYISYLNSLHNYSAQNSNAYGEKNVENVFFQKVEVPSGVSKYIKEKLMHEEPHVLILTGHAGDGKTSIMYQVLKEFDAKFDVESKMSEIVLPNGKTCCCVKDFSELNDDQKKIELKKYMDYPADGKYVFMVSNTGPLINTFGKLFDEEQSEKAKVELIEAMDKNTGEINEIGDYRICIINVATIDNTGFVVEFVKNLIKDNLWGKCDLCEKKEYCHILNNKKLIEKNQQRVFEFLKEHYIWLVEHGIRLTIRSMTEQLAYMITGGIQCEEVVQKDKNQLLFFNLFFGYIGLKNNRSADTIVAIREAKKCRYDSKRMRADEKLMIDCDYSISFGTDMENILVESQKKDGHISGWSEFVRRAYMFTNIETDQKKKSEDMEDIFSRQFERYIKLRNGEIIPSKAEVSLIIDALSMVYMGKVSDNTKNGISITLNKNSGLMQNVQLVMGEIPTRQMKLIQEKTKDGIFDEKKERYVLKLCIDKKNIDVAITLPMLDYFEELRNGVIETNIDPQLSHGVESLKAQLTKQYKDEEENEIEIIVMKNSENKNYQFEITSENKIIVNS